MFCFNLCFIHEFSEFSCSVQKLFNPLSAKFIKWSNTLKQIVGNLPTICLSVFDHFSGLAFKGLMSNQWNQKQSLET